jgi:hypothetical protein
MIFFRNLGALAMAVVLTLLATSRANAQNGSQFKDWYPSPAEMGLKPKTSCAELRGLTGYEFSVVVQFDLAV